ncbi:MAG: exopolysaccharide transport family protein [Pseudomonadota bacterium]
MTTAIAETDTRPRPTVPNPVNPILWLFQAFWQYKWLIAAIVAAGLVGAFVLASRLPDTYTASGLVEIDPEPDTVLPEQRSSGFIPPETITETEVQVIRSSRVLSQVVEELDLEFSAANPLLREVNAGDPSVSRQDARNAIVNDLSDNLDVRPTGRSFVVEVSYKSLDPNFSADVVNAVMGEYLGVEISTARDFSRETVSLLSERLAELREDLDAKERAVQDFRTQSRIAEGAGTNILSEQLARLNEELIRAQAALASAAANVSSSERTSDPAALPQVVNSTLIQSLREQEAEQARAVDELETLYRATHPRLIQARSALAALRDTIQDETRKIASSLGTSEEVEEQRVVALEAEVEKLRDRLNSQRGAEIELRRLEREVDGSRRVYEAFLDRFNTVQGTTGFERPQGRIIAAALPPVNPSGPNRLLVMAGGGVLSGALAFALVVAAALFDSRVRTSADVARASGLSPVAVLPPVPGSERDILSGLLSRRRNAQFADAITQLRAAVLLGAGSQEDLFVAITSPDEATAHAPLAVALAQAAAIAGDQVVLVDADFADPAVNQVLGSPNEYGLSNVVADGGSIDTAVQRDDQSSLLFVSAGTLPDPSLYRAPAMDAAVDRLADFFSTVIINLPTVSEQPDAQVLTGVCDVALITVRAGVTSRRDLRDVVSRLRFTGYGGRIATVLIRG